MSCGQNPLWGTMKPHNPRHTPLKIKTGKTRIKSRNAALVSRFGLPAAQVIAGLQVEDGPRPPTQRIDERKSGNGSSWPGEERNLDIQVSRRKARLASEGNYFTCEASLACSGGHGTRTRNPLRGN